MSDSRIDAVKQAAAGHWPDGHTKRLDPLEAFSRAKHVSVDALKTYGAKIDGLAVAFPMYGADGKQCSTFTIWPNGSDKQQKGMNEKGKPAGVFLPHVDGKPRLPTPGQTWLVVEGCKDPAALQSLGYPAVGMSTKQLGKSFSPMFGGVDVTIIPDRDEAGEQGSNKTAARLRGHAASIKIAILPAEFTAQNGADVRDVLKLTDGETLVRDAIDNAKPWQPPTLEATAEDIPTIMQPDGRTEAVNARRFAARFDEVVRWCDPWQKWLVWDGRRWAIDDQRRIDALAKDIGAALWQDMATAALTAEKESITAMMGYCKASNSGNGIRNMLALARSEPGVPILPNELDKHPWLLNVANGTINLRSGDQRAHNFRPHDRNDFITKLCPVEYDPVAKCPTWLAFLNRIMGANEDLIRYVQRLIGYCLTGDTSEHILPFLYGNGANGKSTFVGTILALLGEDYAIKAAPDLLLAKKGAHPTELTDLHGRRFAACIEAEDGRRMAESLVKELTGGDKVRARRMREDFWEFHATHKVWLAANHKPTIRGQDYGIWRRVKLIPFTVVIPESEQDKQLLARLMAELPAVLNWALAGCDQWQHEGLAEPDEVKAATESYKSEMDSIGRFIDECCILGNVFDAGATDLFKAFKEWGGTMTQTRFGDELAKRGYADDRYTSGPNKGRKMRRGIALVSESEANE